MTFSGRLLYDSAAIFIVVPVDDIVTAILNTPMAAISGENLFGVNCCEESLVIPIDEFRREMPCRFFC